MWPVFEYGVQGCKGIPLMGCVSRPATSDKIMHLIMEIRKIIDMTWTSFAFHLFIFKVDIDILCMNSFLKKVGNWHEKSTRIQIVCLRNVIELIKTASTIYWKVLFFSEVDDFERIWKGHKERLLAPQRNIIIN